MTNGNSHFSDTALSPVIEQILEDITQTTLGGNSSATDTFETRYKEYQAEARALSLMIKAESDLRQRHKDLAEAVKKESYIAYENLPPLTPGGLEKLEKRFAHLAYKTEIERQLPALSCKS